MLLWIMYCDFHKFSFFKMIITAKSEEGIKREVLAWFNYMTKQGLLKAKPKPKPVVEVVEEKLKEAVVEQ